MKKQIIISIISFLAIVGVASAGNYIVQRGDTLSQLALDSGNSVESIVVANNIADKNLIYVGQSLNIPNLLGGNTPFRPSEFTTTLATSLTEGHSGTTLKVNSITTKDGQTLSSEILGDVIVLHINSGKSNAEIVKCTGLTTATRTFTGCTFGYRFDTNTTATANVKAHSQGETVIISNDDLYLTTQYPTIDGNNIFLGNNYIASSTQDVVRFYMTTSTDIYLWANKATGQFGYSTTSNEYAFNSNGTTFSAVNPMNLTSGELKLATSTAWFNLVDSKLSVATSTTSNFSLAWNDKWLATSTIPNLTMGNATTTNKQVIGYSHLNNATSTLNINGDSFSNGNTIGSETIILGTAGQNISARDAVYATNTDGTIWKTDSDDATTTLPFIGFALNDVSTGGQVQIQTTGNISGFTGLEPNNIYYLYETAGSISTTTGVVEGIAGYAISETVLNIDKRNEFGMQYISTSAVSVASGNTVYSAPIGARIAIITDINEGSSVESNSSQATIAKSGAISYTYNFDGPNAGDDGSYSFNWGVSGITVTENSDANNDGTVTANIYWYR